MLLRGVSFSLLLIPCEFFRFEKNSTLAKLPLFRCVYFSCICRGRRPRRPESSSDYWLLVGFLVLSCGQPMVAPTYHYVTNYNLSHQNSITKKRGSKASSPPHRTLFSINLDNFNALVESTILTNLVWSF